MSVLYFGTSLNFLLFLKAKLYPFSLPKVVLKISCGYHGNRLMKHSRDKNIFGGNTETCTEDLNEQFGTHDKKSRGGCTVTISPTQPNCNDTTLLKQ